MRAQFCMVEAKDLREGDWFLFGEDVICVATDENSFVKFYATGHTIIVGREEIKEKVKLLDVTVTAKYHKIQPK